MSTLRKRIEALEGRILRPRAGIAVFVDWLAAWRRGDRPTADHYADVIRKDEQADPSLTAAIDEVSER